MDKIYTIEKKILPMISLRGMWIFPNNVTHFDIGRKESLKALSMAQQDDDILFLTTQKNALEENPTKDEVYHTGITAKIKQVLDFPNGVKRILVEGLERAKILDFTEEERFFEVEVEEYIYHEEELEETDKLKAVTKLIIDDASEYIGYDNKLSPEIMLAILDIKDPSQLSDIIIPYLELSEEETYYLLNEFDIYKRMIDLHQIFRTEIELLKLGKEIDEEISTEISDAQKEYYIREQISLLKKELGEEGDDDSYIEKVQELGLSEKSEEHVLKEARRLEQVNPSSPETTVILNYLDHILDIPWNEYSESEIDIEYAREILEKEHHGLKDVKERILEFLAVQKLTDSLKGPILCFVGPPGVGKTSIARSIAHATNREFVSMRLGGVRDEAEIRGHRKTYIGAMPGRIISSLEKAEKMNPVFLLDEIDKLASDFRGDPASALLEVLDPEQNDEFVDSFIEIPVDLSDCLFITTANSTDPIPSALLDRMEVIRISSYTEDEKLRIAIEYLIPNQLKVHGVDEDRFHITRDAIRMIINNYTREAGVRNLERNIGSIIRKVAVQIVEKDRKHTYVNPNNLENYLGIPKVKDAHVLKEDEVGIANGLAWTEIGGVMLVVEANTMSGKGKVQLTGNLGDTMQESAKAAISYIRSNQENLKIDGKFYEEQDIHVHVPEGAVPKDGPSAGITIATALVSRLTGRKVSGNFAMTGEITLNGRVLPIGGVKEKVLAAHREGIENIILPIDNKVDLEELENNIKRELSFHFVENIGEVLDLVLL